MYGPRAPAASSTIASTRPAATTSRAAITRSSSTARPSSTCGWTSATERLPGKRLYPGWHHCLLLPAHRHERVSDRLGRRCVREGWGEAGGRVIRGHAHQEVMQARGVLVDEWPEREASRRSQFLHRHDERVPPCGLEICRLAAVESAQGEGAAVVQVADQAPCGAVELEGEGLGAQKDARGLHGDVCAGIELELTPCPVVDVDRLADAIGPGAEGDHRARRRRDHPGLAEDEAQGIDQVHPEIEHGAASRVLRLEAPRDRTAGIQ